jgi:hypothetical protein
MSLGLLVGRFGKFLTDRSRASAGSPARQQLASIDKSYGHHLVALALLARADGESALSECEVILRYCLARAQTAGIDITPAERLALKDHLSRYRPSRNELDLAIKRMRQDSKEDIAALIAAALEIVDADGERRPRELQFLTELSSHLAKL